MVTQSEIVQEFRSFVEENGPGFIYGHVCAPYEGCFYLNCIVLVKDDYAYLLVDLAGTKYKRFLVEPPEEFKDNKYFKAGCIKLENLEKVVSSVSSVEQLEIHPISDIVANTPYSLYWPVWNMLNDLGYETKGLFTCRFCKQDYNEIDSIEFLEGEFRGNSGIGIEVGEPCCDECKNERTCYNCGSTVEPDELDEDGYCEYCKSEE